MPLPCPRLPLGLPHRLMLFAWPTNKPQLGPAHPSLRDGTDPLHRIKGRSMAKETVQLAEYAVGCRYDDIPADVRERAKQCIADTVAVVIFGYQLPWSRMVGAFAESNGAGGRSRILGLGGRRVHAPA